MLDITEAKGHQLPYRLWKQAVQLGQPDQTIYKGISLQREYTGGDRVLFNDYDILVGPGVIFAVYSERYDDPHWSGIELAVYRHFETEGLKYVFRFNVTNTETSDFVTKSLYSLSNDKDWPSMNLMQWELVSPKYHALLATPIVRGVVGFLLEGFPRESPCIPCILTWVDDNGGLNMCIPIPLVPLSSVYSMIYFPSSS